RLLRAARPTPPAPHARVRPARARASRAALRRLPAPSAAVPVHSGIAAGPQAAGGLPRERGPPPRRSRPPCAPPGPARPGARPAPRTWTPDRGAMDCLGTAGTEADIRSWALAVPRPRRRRSGGRAQARAGTGAGSGSATQDLFLVGQDLFLVGLDG